MSKKPKRTKESDNGYPASPEALGEYQVSFLTGLAGSGKTTCLRGWLDEALEKRDGTIRFAASTGVAAINLSPSIGTVNHLFGYGLSPRFRGEFKEKEAMLRNYPSPATERGIGNAAECRTLVLEEASMIGAVHLDWLDFFLRRVSTRKGFDCDRPFGGRKVVLVGDPMQLHPVKDDWFWKSNALNDAECNVRMLGRSRRQERGEFLDRLNRIRHGDFDGDVRQWLRSREEKPPDDCLSIVARNEDVERLNAAKLTAFEDGLYTLEATVTGPDTTVGALFSDMPVPPKLTLAEGAQVMIRVNGPDLTYVNGTLGTLLAFDDDGAGVLTRDGKEVWVPPFTWCNDLFHNAEYWRQVSKRKREHDLESQLEWFHAGEAKRRGKGYAAATQVPVRVCYGLTVHKAQGLTLDLASVDLTRASRRAPALAYVALSRLRTEAGLYTVAPDKWPMLADPEATGLWDALVKSESNRNGGAK